MPVRVLPDSRIEIEYANGPTVRWQSGTRRVWEIGGDEGDEGVKRMNDIVKIWNSEGEKADAMLSDAIEAIPGEDLSWKSSARDKYKNAADMLLSKGLTAQETYDTLDGLFWAVADMFGM